MFWWYIAELGAELARRGEMSQQEIESFLSRNAEAGIATDERAQDDRGNQRRLTLRPQFH